MRVLPSRRAPRWASSPRSASREPRSLEGAVGRVGAGCGVRHRRGRGALQSRALHASVPRRGALSSLTPRRRRSIHQALADLADTAEERARHLAAATTEPSPDLAAAIEAGAPGALSAVRPPPRPSCTRTRRDSRPRPTARRRPGASSAPGTAGSRLGHRPGARTVPPRRPRIASGPSTRRGPHLGGLARAHEGEGQRDRAARRTPGVRDRRHDARNLSHLPRAGPAGRRRRAVRAAPPPAGGGSLGRRGGRRADGGRAVPRGFRR